MITRLDTDEARKDRALVRFIVWFSLCLFELQIALGGHFSAANVSLFQENGPIERLQLVILFFGALLMTLRLSFATPLRPLYGVLAVLYLSLFLRELDVRGMDLAPALSWALGPARPFWLTALWVAALGGLWFSRRAVISALRTANLQPLLRLGFLSAIFYVLSNLAEHGVFPPLAHGREFAEESLETVFEWCLAGFALLADRLRPTRL